MSQERYVVVGFGWVGQANALALYVLGHQVAYFDPGSPVRHYAHSAYDSVKRLEDVNSWDSPHTWYVVCVGDQVADNGEQDVSSISKALESLRGLQGGVILRSTVLPEHLESMEFDYYLPEFLHEKFAVEECMHPYFFVMGKKSDRPEPEVCATWRSGARQSFDGTPREGSLIKYLSNIWNALRIAFVNEFGDAVGHPKSEDELAHIERVLAFLFENRNYLRYGRAFGGHCLPKDTRAFLRSYGGVQKMPLLSGLYATNEKHRALEVRYPLMPEWYSEWPNRHIGGWRALKELGYSIGKHVGLFS